MRPDQKAFMPVEEYDMRRDHWAELLPEANCLELYVLDRINKSDKVAEQAECMYTQMMRVGNRITRELIANERELRKIYENSRRTTQPLQLPIQKEQKSSAVLSMMQPVTYKSPIVGQLPKLSGIADDSDLYQWRKIILRVMNYSRYRQNLIVILQSQEGCKGTLCLADCLRVYEAEMMFRKGGLELFHNGMN